MRKLLTVMIGFGILLSVSSVSLAQESTATPVTETTSMQPAIEDDEADGATLETVTADTASFVGTTVTLQGTVAEFVNARTFVLSEGAAVDDDQVLVINTGSGEFDLHLAAGQRVQVTGTVYYSLDEGGFDEVATAGIVVMDPSTEGEVMMPATEATEAITPMAADMTPEATEDASMLEPTLVPDVTLTPPTEHDVNLAAMREVIEERYPSHTIVTVSSVDQIIWMPEQS